MSRPTLYLSNVSRARSDDIFSGTLEADYGKEAR